jgi:integrase
VATIRRRIVGNDPRDVRWDAILEGRDGKKRTRKVKTFFTQKEAKDYLVLARGAQPSVSASFIKLKDDFLKFYEQDVAAGEREASTLKQLKEHFKLHIVPDTEFSGRKCCDISTATVQEFLDRLRLRVSPAMAVKVKGTLSQVLAYGAGRGFLTFNPARDTKLKTSKRPDIEETVEPFVLPTKEELARLLASAKAYDNTGRAEAAVRLMMFAGLRISEVRGLRWSDCDLECAHPKVTVHQKADLAGKLGKVKSKTSKRDVGIGPDTVAALKRWGEGAPDGPYVLSNEAGKPITHSNLWNRFWVPLMNKAGLVAEGDAGKAVREWSKDQREYKEAAFGFHMLRHVYASLQIAQGVIPKRLQKLMGHSTLKLTMDTYGHLWPDDEADRARAATVEHVFAVG